MFYVVVANLEDENETVYSSHKKHYQAEVAASEVQGYDSVSVVDDAYLVVHGIVKEHDLEYIRQTA